MLDLGPTLGLNKKFEVLLHVKIGKGRKNLIPMQDGWNLIGYHPPTLQLTTRSLDLSLH